MNLGVVWEQVVRELSAGTLSPQQRAWMRVTRPIGLLDGTALLAAPSDFAKDAIERALREPITDALSRRLGRAVSPAEEGRGGRRAPRPPPPILPPVGENDTDTDSNADREEVDEETEALATVHEI